MPSRKRAKGRERKLKQQAREPVERSVSQPPPNGENINLTEQNIRRIEQEAENVRCYHGGYKHKIVPGLSANDFIDSIPRGHPVTAFTETFIETMTCENCHAVRLDSLKMTFEKHQEVWKDDAMRKMTIDRMVSIGTDSIIGECIDCARTKSEAIIMFEKYTSGDTFDSVLSKASEDIGYILNAEQRDIIRFYKKRIPCSCLDELYSEIKKSQDRGIGCDHCNQSIKRKDIKQCKRCKCANYCSRECQVSDWPAHKEYCKEMCSIPKNAKKERQKLQEGT